MREAEVTKILMKLFYRSLNGQNYTEGDKEIKFDFQLKTKLHCETEKAFLYKLPDGYPLTHKADIAIIAEDERYILNPCKNFVSIEVKHESSVTDQFKCRSYDIQHLKSNYPHCFGIMLYVKGNSGISPEHAKKISYPYDYFFNTTLGRLSTENLNPLIKKIKQFLQ